MIVGLIGKVIKKEPTYPRYSKKSGYSSKKVLRPNDIIINKKVKPIVAPLIKEKVFEKPLLIPEVIIIILTGPGDIDIAKEKDIIVKSIVSVINAPFLFKRVYDKYKVNYCTKLTLYSLGVVATIFKKFHLKMNNHNSYRNYNMVSIFSKIFKKKYYRFSKIEIINDIFKFIREYK